MSQTASQGLDPTMEFIRLGPKTGGVLYNARSSAPEARIGLIWMHPNSDTFTHLGVRELAKRGFCVLSADGQYVNSNRETMIWENLPLDLKPAVTYLRGLPGIDHVVLTGHSGGGQLMPFYQNVAENGLAACQVRYASPSLA